jgi:hypothetical protein
VDSPSGHGKDQVSRACSECSRHLHQQISCARMPAWHALPQNSGLCPAFIAERDYIDGWRRWTKANNAQNLENQSALLGSSCPAGMAVCASFWATFRRAFGTSFCSEELVVQSLSAVRDNYIDGNSRAPSLSLSLSLQRWSTSRKEST